MEKKYSISDASRQVEVENHVLRYWEEELGLNIHRNSKGHRFYTDRDIKRFAACVFGSMMACPLAAGAASRITLKSSSS